MRNILYIYLVTIIFMSCMSNKTATKDQKNEKQNSEVNTKEALATDSYRFIASFISFGGGPDIKLVKKFTDYISDFNTKKGKTIVFERFAWGREGESDYCFKLTEISTKEQLEFIDGAKNILGSSKLVFLSENTKCIHKR